MARFYDFASNSLTVVDDNGRLIMSANRPVVEACIPIADLQNWILTLEKAIEEEPNIPQALALQNILIFMKAAFTVHKQEHVSVIDVAPEEIAANSEIERYLIQYAQSIAEGGF